MLDTLRPIEDAKLDTWAKRRSGKQPEAVSARTPFDVDYGRIIHSASFRRLQGKTQILNLGDSDFYRTRLTHSLEVAQVGVGILHELKNRHAEEEVFSALAPDALVQSICLVHDLGHPPFGHGGELALNYCMRDKGGFEGNGQTLRILGKLERFSKGHGADLTRRALLGVLKYPAPFDTVRNEQINPSASAASSAVHLLDRDTCKPPKCYMASEQDIVTWLLEELVPTDKDHFLDTKAPYQENGKERHGKSRHKSLDCSIMDLADDISNGIHDLEDAISLKLVDSQMFRGGIDAEIVKCYLDHLIEKYPRYYGSNTAYESFIGSLFSGDGSKRKMQTSMLVNFLIGHAIIEDLGETFEEPLLRYRVTLPNPQMKLLKALKDFVYDKVIASPSVQHLEFKGQQMVVDVFNIIAHEPKRFLPESDFNKYVDDGEDIRVICDHVAGMTDNYLLKLYERLLAPRAGSVFDHL